MGKSYYLSDLEIEILKNVIIKEMGNMKLENEYQPHVIDQLATKLYNWDFSLK
jgi:hypothetical protein